MSGCVYRTADSVCKFWSDNGKGIVSYCDYDDCVDKKPSNADKIREMTDEELAQFMAPYESGCPRWNGKEKIPCTKRKSCRECWLDWLRQEAES